LKPYPECPRVSFDTIRRQADQIRRRHMGGDAIPVDVEMMIERNDFWIDPVAGLKQDCDIDACLSSDARTIYIDKDYFPDERQLFRMRFTLAREMGHAVLHRDLYHWYAGSEVSSVIEWASLIRDFQTNADPFFE
jgi:Zn-dependent peptidase ImmA (M78 family)